jgi:hypothetical protein
MSFENGTQMTRIVMIRTGSEQNNWPANLADGGDQNKDRISFEKRYGPLF